MHMDCETHPSHHLAMLLLLKILSCLQFPSPSSLLQNTCHAIRCDPCLPQYYQPHNISDYDKYPCNRSSALRRYHLRSSPISGSHHPSCGLRQTQPSSHPSKCMDQMPSQNHSSIPSIPSSLNYTTRPCFPLVYNADNSGKGPLSQSSVTA